VLGAARNCPRLTVALALLLAADPAAAQQSAPLEPARLEAIYSAANQATAAGDDVTAAERYADVLDVLPESRENHESRALALLDSVAARRRAQASGTGSQLCRARDLVRDYLATARTIHGAAAAGLDGVRQAEHTRDALTAEIADLLDPTCPGDPSPAPPIEHHEPPRLAPAPGPDRDRRVIAGATLLGAGGLSLGLMALGLGLGARAEQAGREARAADPTRDIDDLLDDGFLQRGQAGNRLAIAGGVLTGVTVVIGAALLLLARTRPRHAGANNDRTARRSAPAVSPAGIGLRF
jgi:hypothetical protein